MRLLPATETGEKQALGSQECPMNLAYEPRRVASITKVPAGDPRSRNNPRPSRPSSRTAVGGNDLRWRTLLSQVPVSHSCSRLRFSAQAKEPVPPQSSAPSSRPFSRRSVAGVPVLTWVSKKGGGLLGPDEPWVPLSCRRRSTPARASRVSEAEGVAPHHDQLHPQIHAAHPLGFLSRGGVTAVPASTHLRIDSVRLFTLPFLRHRLRHLHRYHCRNVRLPMLESAYQSVGDRRWGKRPDVVPLHAICRGWVCR
eukprot:3936645-Rhodomonas_salina.3